MRVHARFVPASKTKSRACATFFKNLQSVAKKTKLIDITDIDVLMLRNDPSNDAVERPWAHDAGIQFGRRAAQRGVLVLNDPGSLSQAIRVGPRQAGTGMACAPGSTNGIAGKLNSAGGANSLFIAQTA